MSDNMKIGIFQGKKATYNKAILEALFKYGPLKSWEIARKIYLGRYETKDRAIAYAKTQGIYSVVIRKRGRLSDLNQKEYVLCKDKRWELCFPKGLALLVLRPEMLSEIHPYYMQKPVIDVSKLARRKLKLPFGLRLQVDPREFQTVVNNLLKSLDNETLMRRMAESLKKLLQQGIDLDRINSEHLVFLVFQDMQTFISNWVQESKRTG